MALKTKKKADSGVFLGSEYTPPTASGQSIQDRNTGKKIIDALSGNDLKIYSGEYTITNPNTGATYNQITITRKIVITQWFWSVLEYGTINPASFALIRLNGRNVAGYYWGGLEEAHSVFEELTTPITLNVGDVFDVYVKTSGATATTMTAQFGLAGFEI